MQAADKYSIIHKSPRSEPVVANCEKTVYIPPEQFGLNHPRLLVTSENPEGSDSSPFDSPKDLSSSLVKPSELREVHALGVKWIHGSVPSGLLPTHKHLPLPIAHPIEWELLVAEAAETNKRTGEGSSPDFVHLFQSSSNTQLSSTSPPSLVARLLYCLHFRGFCVIRLPKSHERAVRLSHVAARRFFNSPSWNKDCYRFFGKPAQARTTRTNEGLSSVVDGKAQEQVGAMTPTSSRSPTCDDEEFQGYLTPAPGLHELFELRRNGRVKGYRVPEELSPILKRWQTRKAASNAVQSENKEVAADVGGAMDLYDRVSRLVLEVCSGFCTGDASAWLQLLDNSALRLIHYDRIAESPLDATRIQRDHLPAHTDQGLITVCPLSSFPGLDILPLHSWLEFPCLHSIPYMREELLEYLKESGVALQPSPPCATQNGEEASGRGKAGGEKGSPGGSSNGSETCGIVGHSSGYAEDIVRLYANISTPAGTAGASDSESHPPPSLPWWYRPKRCVLQSSWWEIERLANLWKEDCLFVFAGDSLSRISNNFFPALMHRPNVNGCRRAAPSRISTPFFLRAKDSALLDASACMPERVGPICRELKIPVTAGAFGNNVDKVRDRMPWKDWPYYSSMAYSS